MNTIPIKQLSIAVCTFCVTTTFAQDGSLDNSFSTDGKVITTTPTSYPSIKAVAIQADGKIVVSGYDYNINGFDYIILRYNPDGSLDNSFDTDGMVITDLGSAEGTADLAIQADGKIVIVGSGNNAFNAVRYNTDGSLDTSFDGDGSVTTSTDGLGECYAVAIQPDGKILLGGLAFGTPTKFAIVRYNTDGSLDNTFDSDGISITNPLNADVYTASMSLHSDGKIALAGNFNGDFVVARFNSDGSLDNSFDTDGVAITDFNGGSGESANAVIFQQDGKIVVAGRQSISGDLAIARYNTDGSLDNSFDTDGLALIDFGNNNTAAYASSICIQSDGKLIIGGYAIGLNGNLDYALTRLTSNGSLDASFDTDGKQLTSIEVGDDYGYDLALQEDGKIVVAGTSENPITGFDEVSLARFNNPSIAGMDAISINELSIFPNPFTNELFVQNVEGNEGILTIYSSTMQLIQTVNITENDASIALEMASFSKGVYFISFETLMGKSSRFLIKN